MKLSKVDHRIQAATTRGIETLESRFMLSATLLAQIPSQTLFASQAASSVNLGTYFKDPMITGTAVNIETSQGNIPLDLAASQTPLTVANFVQYINNNEYSNTIIHRSVPGFVIQGGGYTTDGKHIIQLAPVQAEPGISNTFGTIAMALSTGPNSGTSEWFINLGNNSKSLDGNGNGGPFTAFGHVIYGGMTVASAIAALGQVNASAENSAWNTLPVNSIYNGATAVPPASPPTAAINPIPAADLVTSNTVLVPGGLTYSVTAADQTLVTPIVSNGVLTLTPVAGALGTTNLTITATDMGGNVATSTFPFTVTNGTSIPVAIGTGGAKSVTYTDSNGTTSTVTMTGHGAGTVFFSGSGLNEKTSKKGAVVSGSSPAITSIQTSGADASSVITVTSKGGTHTITVAGLTTQSLKSFNAKSVILDGNVTVSGSIGSVSVAAISGCNWTVGGTINSVKAGSLTNSTLSFAFAGLDIKNLSIAGAIAGSLLQTTGSLGAVSGASLDNSSIDAGVGVLPLGQILPTAFTTDQTIASVKLRNSATSFSNSEIASANIGNLSLGTLVTSGGGGIAAKQVRSLSAFVGGRKLALKKLNSTSKLSSILASEGISLGNVVIELL